MRTLSLSEKECVWVCVFVNLTSVVVYGPLAVPTTRVVMGNFKH